MYPAEHTASGRKSLSSWWYGLRKQDRYANVIVAILVIFSAVVTSLVFMKASNNEKLDGIYAYKAGKYDLAIQELEAYQKQHPIQNETGAFGFTGKSHAAYRYLGLSYLKKQRYEDAIRVFTYMGGPEDFYRIGLAHLGEKNYSQARSDFNKAIDMERADSNSKNIDLGFIDRCQSYIDKIDKITGHR